MPGEEKHSSWRRSERRVVAAIVTAVLISTVLLSAFLAVAYPAAASAARGVNPAQASRTLRIGVSGLTAVTLNPNAITLVLEFIPVYNVYSTLVTRDASLSIVPDLAYRWEPPSDGVTWTFHLVSNAYFTDPMNPADRSHPVTADDVVFSYYLVKNNTGSILNSYTSQIDRIEKVDTYTVRIVTKAPFAAMDSTLTAVPIFPMYLWQSIRNPVTQEPFPYPVGSGAMYYDPNSDLSAVIILHRNPNYFGDAMYCQLSRPEEVRFILYTSSGTMIDEFGSGSNKLDAIFNIPASSFLNAPALQQSTVSRIQVSGGFVGEVAANAMTDTLRAQYQQFHTGHNSQILATNQVVRQAVAMSIDRAAIVRYAYQGLATLGDSLVPSSNPWHYPIPPANQYDFDPAAARAMLNAAGWAYDSAGNPATATTTPLYKAGGTQGLVFRFYTPDNHPEFEPAVANITAWLGQAGIQTTDSRGNYVPGYELKPVNQMNSIWKALDYDIWLWDWVFSRVSDPSLDILEVQTTDAIGPTSDNGYSNATFDALYNESLVTVNPSDRRNITNTMQQMLYDYASYIIPYYADDLYAVTSDPGLGNGWQNWGDWTKRPGLTVDSSLPALYFNLYPADNPPPVISAFPAVDFVSGAPASVSVVASDPNDVTLSYTWDFGDGTAPETTSTASTTHTYASPGTYALKVRVTDTEWPTCATSTATISPGTANGPPSATLGFQFPASGHGWEHQAVNFSVTVSDPEGDPLYITWAFGDQATATNYVTSTSSPTTVTQSHVYASPGNYSFAVNVTDNQTGAGHIQSKPANIPIWTTPTGGGGGGGPGPGVNPLINYGVPLGIVAVILIAAAVVLIRRSRARTKEEREEEPPRQPPPPPPPS